MNVTESCGNCEFFGDTDTVEVKRSGNKYPLTHGPCRVAPPALGSQWIGTGRYGDAWVGLWPFVPRDAWCGQHLPKKGPGAATTVEVTNITLEV